jgi:hypothetical protein
MYTLVDRREAPLSDLVMPSIGTDGHFESRGLA